MTGFAYPITHSHLWLDLGKPAMYVQELKSILLLDNVKIGNLKGRIGIIKST